MKKPDRPGLWWGPGGRYTLVRKVASRRLGYCDDEGVFWPVDKLPEGNWRRVLTPAEMDEIAKQLEGLIDFLLADDPAYGRGLDNIRLLRGEEASDG